VRLQLAPILCWKCRQPIKAARGYAFDRPDDPQSQAFIALQLVSDTRHLATLVADLRKHDPSIAPVGFNYSKTNKGQYFSCSCPYCSAISGAFYMTNPHFWETVLAPCRYPDCECRYNPGIECQGCDYHVVNLRLSEQELEEIAVQTGDKTAGPAGILSALPFRAARLRSRQSRAQFRPRAVSGSYAPVQIG
jgi:hypothetical protein